MAAKYIGLDFGTTNTVISGIGDDGSSFLYEFDFGGTKMNLFRSIICFWQDGPLRSAGSQFAAGPWAMARILDAPADCRFIQSFKAFAASPLFESTRIYGRTYDFADLLQYFLDQALSRIRKRYGALPEGVVVGRPVEFAGLRADPALARKRYDEALQRLGFTDIRHVYEPVAAAYHYAQRLKEDATVLVADFGGGTTDFSVISFAASRDGLLAEPLSHSGLGIAGDTFDYRLVDNVISPLFGKGSKYRSWGKELEVPLSPFDALARWEQLSLMASTRTFADLKNIARTSLEPEKLEKFIHFVEEDLGYDLYRSVNSTKASLSDHEVAELAFDSSGISISSQVSRSGFDRWIDEDLQKISKCLDQALDRAGLSAAQIDRVFLTGGTSLVPAVQQLFRSRFPAHRVNSGDQLVSVASGLALIGQDRNLNQWTISES